MIEAIHKSRTMFVFHNGTIIMGRFGDPRGHEEWLRDDLGLTLDDVTRGFIRPDICCIYRGAEFLVPDDYVDCLIALAPTIGDLNVGLGMKVGVVGEQWTPLYRYENCREAVAQHWRKR